MLPGTPDNPNPEAQLARMALTFLERVTLTGKEVQAYAAVNNWLDAKTKVPVDPPFEPHDDSDD